MEKQQTKIQKGRVRTQIRTNQRLIQGNLALVALQPVRLYRNQLEAAILAIKNLLKKEVKIITRVSPNLPVTKKPSEVRMGKGKGNINNWMARLRAGSIILEISSNSTILAPLALKSAQSKLPIKTKIYKKI